MKYLLLLFLLFITSLAHSQCDAFPALLQKGDRLLQNRRPDYQEAINAYTAAIIACPERAQEAQERISSMVNSMNGLRISAQRATLKAKKALGQVETEKEKTQEALERTKQLVGAFYFYDGRFALAFKGNRYYFIDKKGKRVEKLGEWEKAEQFDERGFAKVHKPNDKQDYLLDTSGKVYPVAYDLVYLRPHITALDLGNQGLEILPDSLFTYQQLEVLLLNGNGLKALPDQIGDLTNLTNLNLGSNKLTELPARIGDLSSLTSLYLWRNQLTELPARIGDLSSLTGLYLRGNQLKELPARISDLSNLTILELGYNGLTGLPDWIGELTSLTFLDLGYNRLMELPECVGDLSSLTSLQLERNRLRELPDRIGDLSSLASLDLGGNQLRELPERIGELTSLTSLKLSGNQLTDFPPRISDLSNLTSLELLGNKLTELPDRIGDLISLTSLDLRRNQLTGLPDRIGDLINLTSLELSGNQLTELPERIGDLSSLTSLEFSGNPLLTLSDELLKTELIPSYYLEGLFESYSKDSLYADALNLRQIIQSRRFDPSDYFNISWWLVHCHDFEGAIWAGEAYVAAGGENIGAFSNLAMGYLYNGNYEKAIAIYTTHKKTIRGDRTGQEIFLRDLDATSHIPAKNPEDVARLRAFLEQEE